MQQVELNASFSIDCLEIRGINLGKKPFGWCKMMSKNVQCGQIITRLGRGTHTNVIKFDNVFNGLHFY